MKQYIDFLTEIASNGVKKADRTGTGTRSIFGHQMRFNLRDGFPLVTTKKVHTKSIITELLWFLTGETNARWLQERGCTIWDEWADENGDLGPVYGAQWRSWPTPDGKYIDQIAKVIQQLKTDPDSRRIIVSAWNVGELDAMRLQPCHAFFQFYTAEMSKIDRFNWCERNGVEFPDDLLLSQTTDYMDSADVPRRSLSCQLYQRSADAFLGVPFNIASYALLTHMMAQQCNMEAAEFIWTGGDCHIYSNHADQVTTQINRAPLALPQLKINRKPPSILDYEHSDFEFVGYEHHPAIKAPVAV